MLSVEEGKGTLSGYIFDCLVYGSLRTQTLW